MNLKRYALSVLAAFLAFGLIDGLFDGLVLDHFNESLHALSRPVMIHWLEPLLYVLAAVVFVFIFARTAKETGAKAGAAFGLPVGLLVSGLSAFRQFAVYPIPVTLAAVWFVEGLLQFTVAGALAGLIYRPKAV